MQEYSIVLENINKTYYLYKSSKQKLLGLIFKKRIKPKLIKAVNDVSFKIEQGTSVGIIGKNGAGKSTLLKIITGVTDRIVENYKFMARLLHFWMLRRVFNLK